MVRRVFCFVLLYFFLVQFCVCLHVQIPEDGSSQNQTVFPEQKSKFSLLNSTLNTLINASEKDLVFWLTSPLRIKQFGMEQQNQGQKMGSLGQSHHSTDKSHHCCKSTLPWFYREQISFSQLRVFANMFLYLFHATFCHNWLRPIV